MMGLTSAVHWWEESQMRVLVLGSLFVQFLLFIFSFMRRLAIPGWMRFIMWMAYLAGDALAIYALATLFNRHKPQDQDHGRSLLEVVWAPILLTHLGGVDGITAYNIEDNELWSRHLVTAVSQVTVAIYVFCKSWPGGGDKRLLQAAILLFISGVVKCLAKPWSLKRASINSLVSLSEAGRTTGKQNEGRPIQEYVEQTKAFVRQHEDDEGDHPPSQQQGADEDRKKLKERRRERQREESKRDKILRGEACKLFVDLSSPYPHRLSILKYFWVLSKQKAFRSVRTGLASAFLLLYTRVKTAAAAHIPMGTAGLEIVSGSDAVEYVCCRCIYSLRLLPWAAIGLFHNSHRQDYNDIDVKITYAIFCCTAILESYSTFPIMFYGAPSNTGPFMLSADQWPMTVAQYNLIGYFARNKKHSKLMRTVSLFGCKEFLDQRWCMRSCLSSYRITELVLRYLKAGWKEKIQDADSYRKFNDSRGHWALKGNQDLGWSIKGPFDESFLLWHIATDFCFFSSSVSEHKCAFASDTVSDQGTRSKCGELAACKAVQCRQMSNYMTYLLFVNPEMLLPGTRRNLFTAAYKELEKILDDGNPSQQNPQTQSQRKPAPVKEREIMERLITTMKDKTREVSEEELNKGSEEGSNGSSKGSCIHGAWTLAQGLLKLKKASEQESKGVSKGSFIDDAWTLAQVLLKLNNDEMWQVIQGVWVEMLCFSAGRCRGYLHAKALSSGGEFLSYIWLLMSYMGMETFTERLQREEELPSRQEENNDANPPASNARNSMASSIPRIHNRTAPSTSDLHIDMALVEDISTYS